MSKKVSNCSVCGEPMLKRPQAVYCGPKCQQKAKRERYKNHVENMVSEIETVTVSVKKLKEGGEIQKDILVSLQKKDTFTWYSSRFYDLCHEIHDGGETASLEHPKIKELYQKCIKRSSDIKAKLKSDDQVKESKEYKDLVLLEMYLRLAGFLSINTMTSVCVHCGKDVIIKIDPRDPTNPINGENKFNEILRHNGRFACDDCISFYSHPETPLAKSYNVFDKNGNRSKEI